jgi:hypothetical protein
LTFPNMFELWEVLEYGRMTPRRQLEVSWPKRHHDRPH